MAKERTFVMIKPDAVGRRLAGECIHRLEQRGLKLVGMKMQLLSEAKVREHYAEHVDQPYFPGLKEFIMSGPSIQMVWEGSDAINQVRRLNGATSGFKADSGTIRGDFALSMQKNLIHASDAPETAAREIAIYFEESELLDYTMPDEHWMQ